MRPSLFLCVFPIVLGAGCATPFAKNNPLSEANDPLPVATNWSASTTANTNSPTTSIETTSSSVTTSPPSTALPKYPGTSLTGAASPLLSFNQNDYEQTLRSGKIVILYFYSNECSSCRDELAELQDAFNKLVTDQVVGFKVLYNASSEDKTGQALADQLGVTGDNTKIFLKNGNTLLKTTDSWDQEGYLNQINNLLQ